MRSIETFWAKQRSNQPPIKGMASPTSDHFFPIMGNVTAESGISFNSHRKTDVITSLFSFHYIYNNVNVIIMS